MCCPRGSWRNRLVGWVRNWNELAVFNSVWCLGADSLEYLSVEGLVKAVRSNIKERSEEVGHCTACLTGVYPGGIPTNIDW